MAHGSALVNLLYLDLLTASKTTVIEICPPYTHCVCPGDMFTTMCPFYFRSVLFPFLNITYYGYAVEDEEMDCNQYCNGNQAVIAMDHTSRAQKKARHHVRDVDFVNVDGEGLRKMMLQILNDDQEDNDDDRIIIHRVNLGEDNRRNYGDLQSIS